MIQGPVTKTITSKTQVIAKNWVSRHIFTKKFNLPSKETMKDIGKIQLNSNNVECNQLNSLKTLQEIKMTFANWN